MPARVYKTDKEQLLAEGKLIVSATDDAKFQHKVEMVNLVLGGITPSMLSKYVRESKNTITLWVKTATNKVLTHSASRSNLVVPRDSQREISGILKPFLKRTIQKNMATMSGMVRHYPHI